MEDALTKHDRVVLTGLEDFENRVCNFFESAISETFRIGVSTSSSAIGDDDLHKFLLNALHFSAMDSVALDDRLKELIDDHSKLFVQMEEKVNCNFRRLDYKIDGCRR